MASTYHCDCTPTHARYMHDFTCAQSDSPIKGLLFTDKETPNQATFLCNKTGYKHLFAVPVNLQRAISSLIRMNDFHSNYIYHCQTKESNKFQIENHLIFDLTHDTSISFVFEVVLSESDCLV